ncbi:dTDP-4-dehydrorhamnose 3,5-epimerase [Candidatus Parcubacteria bacterium]|nr:dTDP-4-dehydrorhamnose 3,5-epimerase [Candidatus Parcubacteria bacterium]
MPFTFKKLSIPEVVLIEPRVFADKRGFFLENYKYSEFADFGIKDNFVQDNHSKSIKGVLRGLHYQKLPKAQAKLVRCISGEFFDVAIDIRKGSPTFGKWVGEILSAKNKKMLYVPIGFAHGFCVLSDYAEISYKSSDEYSPEHEGAICWNDQTINISWSIKDPVVSEKDAQNKSLNEADNNFVYGKL